MTLAPIEDIIKDIQAGRMVVIVDDVDRENEGDLVVAAEKVTPEIINFMIQEGKGLICLSLTEERLQALELPLQVTENLSPFGTNFAVSFDAAEVVGEGVTAAGRATTILSSLDESKGASDFATPGFVFPLAAVPGGVLKRRGQTEASVDIARLAGLKPAGVICEVMASDGHMLRGKELEAYCKKHHFKMTSVEDIKRYRMLHEVAVRKVEEIRLSDFNPLDEDFTIGEMSVCVYKDDVEEMEHIAFVKGAPKDGALVRIHSECLTGDVFTSLRCDCGDQFKDALKKISEEKSGVVIYLHQEGRGIGLGNKLKAYELQDSGLDTVDANLTLGFQADQRTYRVAVSILQDLGLSKVRLLTNNPEKIKALTDAGIAVERVPVVSAREQNIGYLKTKRDKMGHMILEEQ